MSNELNQIKKPANPAPPLNALQKPAVKKQEPPKHRSVYDEIAERRKREKHKIGVSSYDSREQEERKFHFGDEISEILDEVKQNKTSEPAETTAPEAPVPSDDDVKVYVPSGNSEIFSDTHKLPVDEILDKNVEYTYSRDDDENMDEENFDVPPIPDPPKRIGVWVAVISVLSVLCVIAAGAYGVVNGYFDSIIKML